MNTERSSRNALPFGTVLNGVYTVEAELGHGGVGIVYRAKHRELGPVAIKEYLPTELVVREGQSVHPVNTDSQGFFEEGLGRFLDEAKQLIRFRTHPSIVSCRDFFRANGTAYLVMDLEEGMSLSELLQARETEGRPFDETDLLTVMVPLLEGLDLVHKAGVLHRDIKPANILIRREDDRPVLIDFGAAKQEFAQHSKSLAPFSPGYAAIEQVAEGRLGAWTDMYGIGAVMWRMVAGGNRPYEPLHPVRVERRAHTRFRGDPDPMPSAQTLGKARFSQHILAAIDQCLELRETDRVQGCKELLQRLREARKPATGIVEATAKEGQPAERQPIPYTTPNRKERHKKAIPAKRSSSGSDLKRSINTVMAVICTGLVVLIPILTIWGIGAGVGMGTIEIILLTFVWGVALKVALSVKNRRKRQRAAQEKKPGKKKVVRAVRFLLVVCGLAYIFIIVSGIVAQQDARHSTDITDATVPVPAIPIQSLPDTLSITIMADKGSVAPIRVTVDDDLRRPYWIDRGDSMTFRMTDRIILEQQLDNVTVHVEGITYPVSRPAGEDMVTLTRDVLRSWFSSISSATSDINPDVTSEDDKEKANFQAQDQPTSPTKTLDAIAIQESTRTHGLSDAEAVQTTSNINESVTDGSNTRAANNANPGASFFTRGSHADDVLRIQGTPTAINTYEALGKETWRYGYSTVEISLPGRRVTDWDNSQNNLKVEMQPGRNVTSTSFFTRGSHADDVLRIQGTPTAINTYEALGKETWRYGYSTVEISLPGRRVTDWDNSQNNLKVEMQPGRNVTSTSFFTRGSHADDVLRIQGTPTAINTYEALGKETWRYGYSTVEISLPGRRVTDWDNSQNNLKVEMQPGRNVTSTSFFTRGSHADDVLRIQGTPTAINTYEALGKETWRYGYSTVEISLPGRRVTDWDNSQNNLKVEM